MDGVSTEWSLPAVHDVIAAAIPEREMLVWKDTRRTYREVATRSRAFAAYFDGLGIGLQRERGELERWECGQSPVALLLHNCPEYIEAMLGAYRARAVPFNVNQHYQPSEIRSLLDMLDTAAVVYHRALGPLLAAALDGRAHSNGAPVLIEVDDGSATARLPGSMSFEEVVRSAVPAGSVPAASPDDLYIVCTGGTTGSPKAVLWRQADIFVSAMGGSEGATAETITAGAQGGSGAWFAAPPLMHAAAQWTAFAAMHTGGTVVLHDDAQPFDARTILETASRERVNLMSIIGDAYARPIIDELRRQPYDLTSFRRLATGGAITSEDAKQALFELIPGVMIVDGYGASETGGMAYGATMNGGASAGFSPAAGAVVLSADRTRFLEPGDDEIGWTARRGRVPLGYLDDAERTEQIFPIVDGERLAVPGDRATLGPDGAIRMLGRDSMVVNTGGEKVFVEEVEIALRRHADVVDALVVGRASERFGQEVVAVVQLRPGTTASPAELREFVAGIAARFKAPRAIAFCDTIGRHPSGKPDYQWVRREAEHAVDAVGEKAR